MSAFNTDGKPKLLFGGMKYADAIVKGSETLSEESLKEIEGQDKPTLESFPEEEINDQMIEFYKGLLEPVA